MVNWLSQAAPFLSWGTAFLLLAGLAKAAVDIMTHQPDNNIFMNWGAWFDNRTSWKRKYKDYDKGDLRPWFPGSIGPLVAFTDFWHAADWFYLRAYFIAGGLCLGGLLKAGAPWWAYLAALAWAAVVLGGVFELTYRRAFRISPKVSR